MLVARPNAPIATPQPAAATHTPSPCRRTRVIQPEKTDATNAPADGAAYKQPDRRRAAAELLAESREERARHPEDHRDRVDGEDPEQRGLAADEPEAFEDRAQARHSPRPRSSADAARARSRSSDAPNVARSNAYAPAKPTVAISTPASAGPATRERLNTTSSTAIAASSWSSGHELRRERVPGRALERVGRRRPGLASEQQRQARVVRERVEQEHDGDRGETEVGERAGAVCGRPRRRPPRRRSRP